MLETLTIRTFKSLEDVTVDLGLVNVFICANGSGKSNLLEALGILSSAGGWQGGRSDPTCPRCPSRRSCIYYKTAFPSKGGEENTPSPIFRSIWGARKNMKCPCTTH